MKRWFPEGYRFDFIEHVLSLLINIFVTKFLARFIIFDLFLSAPAIPFFFFSLTSSLIVLKLSVEVRVSYILFILPLKLSCCLFFFPFIRVITLFLFPNIFLFLIPSFLHWRSVIHNCSFKCFQFNVLPSSQFLVLLFD